MIFESGKSPIKHWQLNIKENNGKDEFKINYQDTERIYEGSIETELASKTNKKKIQIF